MDNVLTQNTQQHVIKVQPNANNPIPLRWFKVLAMHVAGRSKTQISIETGYTENSVWRILHHKDVQYVRQQLMEHEQQEFDALQHKVTEVIRGGLDHPDLKIASIFTGQWLSNQKSKKDNQVGNVQLSAEDMVVHILNNGIQVSKNEQGN